MDQNPKAAVEFGSSLGAALFKLLEVLREENGVLQQHSILSHSGFTDRKNQALRELMVAQKLEASHTRLEDHKPVLERLSLELKLNARLLKQNIDALGEISDIIIGGLREMDSDGTYTRRLSTLGM